MTLKAQDTVEKSRPTKRSIVLGFLLVIFLVHLSSVALMLRHDHMGSGHLPRTALFPVIFLAMLNALWKRWKGRALLGPKEIVIVYAILVVMSSIPGQQFSNYVYFGATGPVYYATPTNGYQDLFFDHIKDWLVPSKDPEAPVISYFFEGMPIEPTPVPWRPWVRPLFFWTLFTVFQFLITIFMAVFIGKQWIVHERLIFPLARIASEVSEDDPIDPKPASLFRTRSMWIAFAIPVVVLTCNGLNYYFPDLFVPRFNLRPSTQHMFSDRPWYTLNWLPLNIYFNAMGVAYLVASDAGFSLWFFYLFRRLQLLVRTGMGMGDHWRFFTNQSIGAFAFLFIFYLWLARGHLKRCVQLARRGPSIAVCEEEREEASLYRIASVGIVVVGAAMVLWCTAAGISPLLAIFMLLIYFVSIVILARIVCEAGALFFWIPFFGPQSLLLKTTAGHLLTPPDITNLCLVGYNLSDACSTILPNILQGFKACRDTGITMKKVVPLMVGSIVVTCILVHPISLNTIYKAGGVPQLGWWERGAPRGAARQIEYRHVRQERFKLGEARGLTLGAGLVAFLCYMRWRYPWWMFHPLGYAACISAHFGDFYWFSIFLGWLAKTLILKLQGVPAWRKGRAVAFGLVLGNTFVLFVWSIIQFFWPISEVLVIE